jgi:hypothetical protein
MYLIDLEYFTGKYDISNLIESNAGDAQLVEQFIDIEVRQFMQSLLGLELFMEFDSYIGTDGMLLPDAPQKWQDLVYGVIYDVDTNPDDEVISMKKWNGLTYMIGTYKKSLLTNYIWCKYFVEKNRIHGNLNSNVIESKNAVRGNPANQYYPIWNELVSMVMGVVDNEWVTLNQFLTDHQADYPTARYVKVEYENRFL